METTQAARTRIITRENFVLGTKLILASIVFWIGGAVPGGIVGGIVDELAGTEEATRIASTLGGLVANIFGLGWAARHFSKK